MEKRPKMNADTLPELKRQIEQGEARLEQLRRDLASREGKVQELAGRRDELLSELRKVEADLASLAGEPAPAPVPAEATLEKNGYESPRRTPGAKGKAGRVKQQEGPQGKQSLKEVLTAVLKGKKKPLPTRELTGLVLTTGYASKSENFANVVQVTLGKMDNVERVPGKGYRLRRG
jgi:hypothetical protein